MTFNLSQPPTRDMIDCGFAYARVFAWFEATMDTSSTLAPLFLAIPPPPFSRDASVAPPTGPEEAGPQAGATKICVFKNKL